MSGIIVGIDGSRHSQVALEWAMREATVRRQPLSIITVLQLNAVGWHGFVVYPADEEIVTQAHEAVAKAAAQLGETAPPTTVQVVVGMPAEVLLEASRNADLLVVGSRGTGGFGKLMMGSVSGQVTQHAQCPVVTVPGDRPRC